MTQNPKKQIFNFSIQHFGRTKTDNNEWSTLGITSTGSRIPLATTW